MCERFYIRHFCQFWVGVSSGFFGVVGRRGGDGASHRGETANSWTKPARMRGTFIPDSDWPTITPQGCTLARVQAVAGPVPIFCLEAKTPA